MKKFIQLHSKRTIAVHRTKKTYDILSNIYRKLDKIIYFSSLIKLNAYLIFEHCYHFLKKATVTEEVVF